LKPFCDGTTIMSGSRYPTFSLVAPLLHKLLEVTLKVTDSDNSVMKCVKRSISADLQGRYDLCDIKKHLRIATFLDPRFKDLSPIVPSLEHECVYENTKAELISLTEESDDEVEGEVVEASRKKKTKLSDFFFRCIPKS